MKKTNEQFIQELRNVFGNKYIYDKVKYEGNRIKVCIVCPEHGDFWALPFNLIRGHGCPKCIRKIWDTESFINESKKKYGDLFDYTDTVYEGSDTRVTLYCNAHHIKFSTLPQNHIHKRGGCPICSKRRRLSNEEIIKKFKEIHGDKYDYSKVDFKTMNKKVTVICPIHGEFKIKPSSHIYKKAGCILCGYELMKTKQRESQNEVIEEFKKIHGDKYDYSKVEYVNAVTPVIIHCEKHNYDFLQTPDVHKRGCGCPKCNQRVLERDIENILKNKYDFVYNFKGKILEGLTLDFYIPNMKIGIECQGIQHYFPVDFASLGEEWASQSFDKNKERDSRKRQLCKDNGIHLIYYMDKKFLKYETSELPCFTDVKKLLEYIENYGK